MVAGKNEASTIDDFIHKALEYQINNNFFRDDAEKYRNCTFSDAKDSDVEWLHQIIEGMNYKTLLRIKLKKSSL